ncbi:MAG TPA: energy transducer TonB [Chthoniobacterales bacterium]
MSRSIRICLAFCVLLAGSHRLPAPIIEPEDKPPAAEQPAKPKLKHRTKTTQSESSSQKKADATSRSAPAPALQGPARFAGAWSGQINQGLTGHVFATFTVSPDATSVQISKNLGGGTREATVNGDTLSWPTGSLGGTTTLTPNNDGQTAQVTLKGLFGSTTATLRRGSAPATTAPSTTQEKSATAPQASTDSSGNGFVALSPSGSMSGPRPESPPEARDQHLSGQGVFLLHFDKPTGNIIDVTVRQSTGSAILDQAAIATLRQWHATPNCPREVPMTITYSSSSQ